MKTRMVGLVSALALMAVVTGAPAEAQEQAPLTTSIPAPQNMPYPSALQVTVDATDLDHKIFSIHETMPVSGSGDFVFMLPKWLPGHHSPGTEVGKIAGLIVHSDGQRIEWTRDTVDMNAFHVALPEGASSIDIDFKFLSATTSNAGRTVMTPDMINLQWNFAAMYPAGYYAKQIPVEAMVKIPAGWGYATGLETASNRDGTVTFKPTDFDTLVDSPIFAGHYFKTWDITPAGDSTPVRLNVMADSPEQLNAQDDIIAIHKKLVEQAYKLYGAHHYNHYDFLVASTDQLGGIGLEHHRSSENSVNKKYLTDPKPTYSRDLLAHEYSHSWNGKYRRGADLWTPNFQVPMRDSLMWVYEGQDQYWGHVLAVRSGLNTKELGLQALANVAANYDNLPAREWRALQDTTNDPIISSRSPQNWYAYQRSEDYYSEGQLIWLDADTLIREKTKGKKSLDDFAKAFFGINNGAWDEATYTFDDVVKTLNGVYAYDWATFLRTRLDGHGEANNGGAPLDGITRGGYRLAYVETPSDLTKAAESLRGSTGLTYSLGLTVSGKDGSLTAVQWGGPAFNAGLSQADTLVAVNGKAFTGDGLKAAVTAAKTGTDPIELLVKRGDVYKTVRIDYHGGLRYPVLQPIDGAPKLLDDILAEKK